MKEVYCITWSGTGRIDRYGCYFDRKDAEKHLKAVNEALGWWYRLSGDKWYIQTLKVKE